MKWINGILSLSILVLTGVQSVEAKTHDSQHEESQAEVTQHEESDHEESVGHSEKKKPKVDLAVMNTPCGLVDSLAGDVQFLDTERSKFLNLTAKSVLPCGAWISVNRGWVQLKHQNGPRIHMGNNTFIQIPDSRKDPKFKGDHAVLYKGEIYAESNHAGEEFNIVTAGARARMGRGKIILIFNLSEDETQLITLSNSATLENRFEPSRKMTVRAGEASSLNFELIRVLPLAPKAVSVATLKPKLVDLQVKEKDQLDAIRTVIARQERKFATPLVAESVISNDDEESHEVQPHEDHSHEKRKNTEHSTPHVVQRTLASEHSPEHPAQSKSSNPDLYLQNPPRREDSALRRHLVNRIMGGDPSEALSKKIQKQEAAEKKHLIEELSHMKPGDL